MCSEKASSPKTGFFYKACRLNPMNNPTMAKVYDEQHHKKTIRLLMFDNSSVMEPPHQSEIQWLTKQSAAVPHPS